MANKKKGPEGFNDWYERNGGQAQETQTRQTSNSSGSAKPQAFNDWYNAGANEPYTTLRFLADDMAGSSRVRAQSRSAWLQEMQYKQQKQQMDKTNSDIAAYNEFQRRQYNQALGNAIGKMAAAPIKGRESGNIDPATLASIGGKVAKGAGNKANSTINVVRNNWEVPDGGNQPRSRGTNDAPYVIAPGAPVTDNSEYEARRMALDELIRANRNMNSVTGSYVMDDLLGYQREESPERTEQKEDTTPQHVQQFATLSSADIKARQDRYNEMVASDLTLARNLLSATFAGVEPARSMARDELGNKWGINAYDAEELRLLADRLERGVVYTDKDGNETTWDKLYNNALNREKAEASILPPEEQAYVQSLYDMTSDELEKKYNAREFTDARVIADDLEDVDALIRYYDTYAEGSDFRFPESEEFTEIIEKLSDHYPEYNPNTIDGLRSIRNMLAIRDINTPDEIRNVIYTDSNGRNYTYQDLYYNAENREKFNKLETDSDALDLVAEGLRLQKQIDMFNAYIVDAGTAAEYAPMVTDLGNKKNLIAERLNERGYDLDRMLGYLNTEDAKQRFLMQSQATAKWTEENPVLANIAAMLATPVQAVEWMANNTGSGNPEDLKNYVPMNYFGMDATNFSSAVRGTTSNMIQNEMLKAGFSDKFAELASETYSGVLSAAQSRILALACTAMAGPGAGEIITLAIMGSSAASETLKESIDRGLDNRHAIITAMSAGVAEAAFEELSLDKFLENVLDPANLPKGILDALRKSQLQRLVEGSEEFFTDIANAISDRIINGDMSEYNTNIRAYMQQNGGDRIDAVKKANKDFVTQVLQSAFGGYIGGGGFGSFALNSVVNSTPFQQAMSPFNNAYNRYQQNRAYQNIGASVIENQNTGALVDAAQMSGDEQLRGLAEQVAEAQTIQKPSRRQQKVYEISTGKLAAETAKTNFQKATESNESVLRQAIETELKNRGLDATDNNISAVRKALSGEELTYDEKYPSYRINAPEIAEAMKERTPEIEEEASKISQEAFARVKNVQKMANADFSERVSKTGEVINTETGKAVEIGEFVKDGDNGITLTTKDGGRVSVADLKFADTTQAALYEEVDAAGFSPEVANQVVRGFDGKGTAAVSSYMNGMLEGMAYGRTHQNTDMNFSGPFYADLSASQKDLAIKLGQMERGFDTEKATASINDLKALSGGVQRKGSVTGVTSSSAGLNNAQRTGIRTIEMLVDNGALTNNFHFFSSVDNGKGRVMAEDVGGLKKGASAPNGFYDPKTGDIYIDVNAGNNGEGTVLFTAAHEVTHFVKQWSPNKFNDLANFLVQEYHGAGISVDGLVREQMRKGSSRHLSYDEAFEEMVADSMQTMFTDGNLAAKLMDLKAKDKTLFDRIMQFVKKLQTGINKVYARYTPDSEEAKALSQIKGAVDRLADTFAEGITAATENYSEVAPGSGIINVSDGDNKGATILSVRDLLDEKSKNKYAGDLVTRFGVTKQEAMDWLNAETSLASIILNPKYSQFLDYIADPDELAIKQNSDYPQGTVDFSNICAKRREFTSVMNSILRKFPDHVFAATDLAKIRTIMSQEGMRVPCGLCYVEDRRQLDSIVAQDFIDAVQRYREGNSTRADGKPFNPNQLKGLEMMGSDTHTPSIYELISIEGRNKLKAEHPNIKKAWVTFNNARGMQSVRLLLNDAEYKREILKYNKKTVQGKNDHGGLRIYSFSDMEMFHLIDIIQVLTDCSIKGVYVQGYTKVNEYAKAVRNTGEKLNRSLIPLGDLGYHMENGKVVLDYDTVEGIDINSPDFFDSKDNPNIGNITIGINDTQIRAAMTSDFVDMIIPFHTGQSREVLGEKGIAEWQNYKDYQTDKDIATGRTSKHQINIYTEVLQPMEKAGVEINKRTFVEKFLEVCKENGLTPRFAQFLNTDANGDYVYTEGYHKMLVDFKTFAQTEVGEYLPQGAIRPIFDNEYITGLLKNYVKEQKTKDAELAKSMPKVVNRITNEIVNPSDVKFSFRGDSKMNATDRRNLNTAIDMDTEGVDSEKIRLATGWFKGYDGRWRNEIDDSDAKLNTGIIPPAERQMYFQRDLGDLADAYFDRMVDEFGGGSPEVKRADKIRERAYRGRLKLEDVLDHPKLYKQYPQLKNINVNFYEYNPNKAQGITDNTGISLAVANGMTYDDVKSVLMHEVQHKIQDIEGFASGSNPEYWAVRVVDEDEEYKNASEKVNQLFTQLTQLSYTTYTGVQRTNPINTALQYAYLKNDLRESKAKNLKANIEYDSDMIKTYEQRAKDGGYYDLMMDYVRAVEDQSIARMEAQHKGSVNAFDLYQRTAGEVEARDVQSRLNLNAKQRKAARPDIDRNNVVFVKQSARDEEYMELAQDPKKNAMRLAVLVDDAAKAAGYTIRAFHGTAADFTRFSRGEQGKNYDGYLQFGAGFYFTPSEAEAKKWVERRRHKNEKENPRVMSVYLNPGRILNVNAMVPEAERDLKAMGLAPAEINYLSSHAYRVIEWLLREKGFTNTEVQDDLKSWGYDALADVNPYKTKGQYIIFDPEMIKSADPVTYDNAGNVIPLSERFNEGNQDIRYSDRDSYFDQAYETMPDGRIRPRNVADLSTEDWKTIYQVTKKLGYGIKSASEAKQVYGRYVGESGFNKEQSEALKAAYGVTEQKGPSANPQRVAQAKKEFGVTYDMAEAGYITTDGSMLDFSGKKEGGPGHVRYMDHREINRVFDTENDNDPYNITKYMNAFIAEGNIRLMDDVGVTMGEIEPTPKQYNVLRKFIERVKNNAGAFYLDISNANGNTVAERDYISGETPNKILGEIKEYYKTGELPESPYGDWFRPSLRDPDAMDTRTVLSNALLETAKTDLEKKFLQDYQSKIAAMNEQQNNLNELRAEIRDLSFAPGPRDKKHINDLRTEANKIANRIATYDKQLLRLESMKGIQNVVEREKAKVKARVQKQNAEFLASYKQQVESQQRDLVEHYNDRIRKIREDWRNRRTEAVAEVREKNRERNEKRKERMSANAYISRIEDTIRDLMPRLQHKNAKTAIPSIFAEPAAKFLSAFDTRTFLKDGTVRPGEANVSREELREALSNLATSIDTVKLEARYGNMDLDPNMVDWINDVKDWLDTDYFVNGTFVLHKMPFEILKELYETVTSLKTAINDATMLYRARAEDVSVPGHSTITHVSKLPTRGNTLLGRAGHLFRWLYAQPSSVFDRFGEGGRTIFKGLMTGQKTEAENVKKILDFTDSTYTRDEVNKWREELHKVTVNGKEYNIPTSYIMELYCMMQDADAQRHILNKEGGIRFDDLELGRGLRGRGERFRNTKIRADEVNAMLNLLTPRQKEVASKLQEFMDRIGADWGNEISFARFGYDAFGEESTGIKNYYPIRTIAEGTKIEAEAKRNNNIYALLNKSFTKERKNNAGNAVIISDIFTTFSNHMSEMAVYNSWALPVIDLIKWYNYSEGKDDNGNEVSVKEAFRVAFNGNADEYITGLLASINSQRSGGLSESIFFRGLRMVNRVAVAGNIRVAVQQPFSISRAMEEINPRYFRALTPAQRRTDHEEMLKYSSFGRWKEMGYYDVDIARPIQTQILKNETVADRVTERSMVLAERGDRFTWDTLWHACKLEALHNGKSGEELLKAAGDKFDDVIARTQVVDSVLTKSAWMRSDKYMYRMTSAFMSEPMTSYNALLRRYDRYVQDAAEHGGRYAFARNFWPITRSLGVFLITQLLNAIVTAPVDAMRDDDDYKTWLEKMMERFKKNALENLIPTNMMPFLSDITDYLLYGSQDRADLAIYTKAIDLGKKLWSLTKKDDNGNRVPMDKFKRNNIIMASLSMVSSLTGLPISNITRDALSIYNTVVGDVIDMDAVQRITGMEDKYGVWKIQTYKDENSIGYQKFLEAMNKDNQSRMEYLDMQMQSNGIDADTIYNGIKGEIEDKYQKEDATEDETKESIVKMQKYFDEQDREMALDYAGMLLEWWDYKKSYVNASDRVLGDEDEYAKFYYDVKPAGITINQYEKYRTEVKGAQGVDMDGDGETDSGTQKAHICHIIDQQNLTNDQKDTLFYARYKTGKIDTAPWHGGNDWWQYYEDNPEDALTISDYNKYEENGKAAGISQDIYMQYLDMISDKTKKEQILPVIDSLPISNDQKDELYRQRGWSENTLDQAPWHQ